MRLFSWTLAVSATLLGAPAAAAQTDGGGDFTFFAGHVCGAPGETVVVPILADNSLGNVQGWQLGLATPAPLTAVSIGLGADGATVNHGGPPEIFDPEVHPGGVTAIVVVEVIGTERLPPGSGYELHLVEVEIPAGAVHGTVFPLDFVNDLGVPPLETIVLVDGNFLPALTVSGSITVATRTIVCTPANANSTGGPAQISATGCCLDPTLHVTGLPLDKNGYFLASDAMNMNPFTPPGSEGLFCLASGSNLGRYVNGVLNSGNTGQVRFTIDPTAVPWAGGGGAGNPLTIDVTGQTWYFSYWFRDDTSSGGETTNFSDAICIDFACGVPLE